MTKEEIVKSLEELDQRFDSLGIPIFARPIHAISEISKKFNVSISLSRNPYHRALRNNLTFDATDLVFRFFEDRYGTNLNIPAEKSRIAIFLRGQFWKCAIPEWYGSINIFLARDKYENEGRSLRVNVLDQIPALSEQFRRSLSDVELGEIWTGFTTGLGAMTFLNENSALPLFQAARSDLLSSADNLCSPTPHFGQSRWSCQQSAEKAIKGLLRRANPKARFTHDLFAISQELTRLCGIPVQLDLIKRINCAPGIRYGDLEASSSEAFEGHFSLLKLLDGFPRQERIVT